MHGHLTTKHFMIQHTKQNPAEFWRTEPWNFSQQQLLSPASLPFAHVLHANRQTNLKHMWISFIFMSERTREKDFPGAFMPLFYKNIRESQACTRTIPACCDWHLISHTLDCENLHLFRVIRTTHSLFVLSPVPFSSPQGYLNVLVMHIFLQGGPWNLDIN